jgi:four helix bundle protein
LAVGSWQLAVLMSSNGHKSLRVYQLADELAMEIFHLSKKFPIEEKYSLTDQIRRSSRSVATNIAEGYRKKQYQKMFVSKLADSDGEAAETQTWSDFSLDCGYISPDTHESLHTQYESVGRMLGNMMQHPEKFAPRGPRNE